MAGRDRQRGGERGPRGTDCCNVCPIKYVANYEIFAQLWRSERKSRKKGEKASREAVGEGRGTLAGL